jgi:ribosomal protein L29
MKATELREQSDDELQSKLTELVFDRLRVVLG